MFAFTSTRGVVDKEISKGKGPYIFRMHGQNYHQIGTLLLEEGSKSRWLHIYVCVCVCVCVCVTLSMR
jgi:hypothetical protein